MSTYGKELILDLHKCNPEQFTRESLEEFFEALCKSIDMVRADLHFWDDLDTPEEEKQTELHTVGTSAVQFILTSNVTIHTLDLLKRVYINIFSCKDFDPEIAQSITEDWFEGVTVSSHFIERV